MRCKVVEMFSCRATLVVFVASFAFRPTSCRGIDASTTDVDVPTGNVTLLSTLSQLQSTTMALQTDHSTTEVFPKVTGTDAVGYTDSHITIETDQTLSDESGGDTTMDSAATETDRSASAATSVATTASSTTSQAPMVTTLEPPHFPVQHVQSHLEERLEMLDCDVPLLPSESRLWRGNETHELQLPVTIPEDCPGGLTDPECLPMVLSWEGSAEIQSGDVLLVQIDDRQLVLSEAVLNRTGIKYGDRMHHAPQTAVYQVTRPGHDHCDVTEGVLLDITPLVVDGRKLVTLYDKDLTEGINLLIVVSDSWGSQCVRLRVTVKSDNCGDNEDCSGKGVCFSNVSMEGYECQCCPGFVGPHCEEQDACYPTPCTNNGICVDISQGHEGNTYQCLCPYGYTGKNCQEETDPCSSMPCQNGATCSGNMTQFRCDCPSGFQGPLCQHNLNECDSSPCVHGICVDQEDGYRCFCQPGFAGQHCEFEYNECESSPCINGGTCLDRVGGYACSCGRGYTGKRCHLKVDLCSPNPCSDHRYCMDRGNNYTCECPRGRTGPDCLMPSRATCSTNPCSNGGTCWSSVDSFYCACRPGFTGKICEDEFIVESVVGGADPQLPHHGEMQPSLGMHLERLHNVYIAAGTLLSAIAIVGLVVAACHCRVHKTYKRIMLFAYPLLPCGGRKTDGASKAPTHHWLSDKQGGCGKGVLEPHGGYMHGGLHGGVQHTPTRTVMPPIDTDMYYTLDFSDSQSSPLIQ